MAKAGDKKRLEQNARHIKRLQALIGGANAAFLVFRLILGRATAGAWLYAGFALTSLVYAGCYKMISGALAPVYDATGALVYSGQDLSLGGALSYFHDLIYISLFVQALGCWTDKAWWTMLAVPGFAAYMLFTHVFLPWWQTPSFKDMPETEIERKRREKRERQDARAAKFRR